jgi:hypothetical protein
MKKFQALGHAVFIAPRGMVWRAYVKKGDEREQIVPGYHASETEAYDRAVDFIARRTHLYTRRCENTEIGLTRHQEDQ